MENPKCSLRWFQRSNFGQLQEFGIVSSLGLIVKLTRGAKNKICHISSLNSSNLSHAYNFRTVKLSRALKLFILQLINLPDNVAFHTSSSWKTIEKMFLLAIFKSIKNLKLYRQQKQLSVISTFYKCYIFINYVPELFWCNFFCFDRRDLSISGANDW